MPSSLRLQAIPAARQLVAALDRRDQRRDRLVAGLVVEVARGEPVRVGAQAVVGRLVGEQRVEDERARAQARLERARDRRRRLSRRTSRDGDASRDERDVERDASRRAATSIAEVSSSNSRAQALRAGDRLLVEDPLLRLGQQVRAVAARGAQVVAAEVEAVVREQLVDALVGERGPLELEEEQRRAERGRALLDAREQRAARGIGRCRSRNRGARRSRRGRRARRSRPARSSPRRGRRRRSSASAPR